MNETPRNLPTVLSPWYVVYKQDRKLMSSGMEERWEEVTEYFPADDETGLRYTQIKGHARVFTNIRDAYRVAQYDKAMIRVLVDEDGAKEFGHDRS